MAGYVGYSKSVNAVEAERSGLMTASALAKRFRRHLPGLTAADVANLVVKRRRQNVLLLPWAYASEAAADRAGDSVYPEEYLVRPMTVWQRPT